MPSSSRRRRPTPAEGGPGSSLAGADAPSHGNGAAAEALAARTAGGGAALPFLAEMEAAFGEDFGSVQASMGLGAELLDLGANAAASGDLVAFSSPSPDRETVAHELAHIVQQRGGSGSGGCTAPRDRDERGAHEAARAVVAGDSVPELAPSSASFAGDWLDDLFGPSEPAVAAAPGPVAGIAERPAADQAQAMRDLDDPGFEALVADVPEGDTAALESLVAECDDPARKLALWQKVHSTVNQRELDEMEPQTDEDPEQMVARVRGEKRVSNTDAEVAADVEALRASGQPLTMADVDALIVRKEHERAIETEFGIELTNEGGTRADRSRVVWTDEELKSVEASLRQVPLDVRDGHLNVTQIHRGGGERRRRQRREDHPGRGP